MSTQLFLGIIAVVFIILVAFLIPFIIRAKNTLKSAETFIKVTQESLIPLLSELKESVERLNKVTRGVETSVQNVQHLTNALGDLGALVDEINNFVKRAGLSFSVKIVSLGIGIKTALGTLIKGIMKKGGNADE